MTYSELKLHWRNKLGNIYNQDECDHLFYHTCYYIKQWGKARVLFEKDTTLTPEDLNTFAQVLKDLQVHKPIQYIFEETEFYKLRFKVDEDVLIPRPETEELVDWVVKDYLGKRKIKLLDIGTGSGCIAVALAKNLISPLVYALDVSPKSLIVADINAKENNVEINLLNVDILELTDAVMDEQFDIIISNPPYILPLEADKMEKNVLAYEPHLALFVSNNDPLQFYKAISNFALLNLIKGGSLYFETHENYHKEVVELLKEKGFINIQSKKDLQNKPRFVKAQVA
ncbi:MAG: peptide chain release factor N(5)-glutamine methyltransferase [Bacteroidia bacterium]|nr:peptide chain release factor N(5)-glutamine methyltransferase [Bacteroidia bacterium]MCZ2248330.1 peptide chain release factor N(5)-glutamine methyltransferase [Bacteroidia bacterium]